MLNASDEKIVGLEPAAAIAGVSHQTIANWSKRYGIGRKVDGEWHIDAQALDAIIRARKILKPE